MPHTSRISHFFTAFRAELVKKRGTGLFWLAAAMGAFPAVASYFSLKDLHNAYTGEPFSLLIKFMDRVEMSFFLLFFPLVIVLVAARLAQIDHRNGGWQLMETLPVKKAGYYFAKFVVLLCANALALLAYGLSCLLIGTLAYYTKDWPSSATLSFGSEEIQHYLHRLLRAFVTSLGMSALLYMLAVRIPQFIWVILIGAGGLMYGLIATTINQFDARNPFHYLGRISRFPKSDLGYYFLYYDWLSLIYAVFFLLVGYVLYSRKGFKRAFLSSTPRLLTSLLVLILMVGAVAWITRDRYTSSYGKTVIAGHIEHGEAVRQGVLYEPVTQDTIAEFEVKDGAFHAVLSDSIPFGTYILSFKDQGAILLTMNPLDSAFCKLSLKEGTIRLHAVEGTVFLENKTRLSSNDRSYMFIYAYLEDNLKNEDIQAVAKGFHKSWKSSLALSSAFLSADGYRVRKSFEEDNRATKTYQYLARWDDFFERYKNYHKKKDLEEPALIAELRAQYPTFNERFVQNEQYRQYLAKSLTRTDTREIPSYLKLLDTLSRLEPSKLKDDLIYIRMMDLMSKAQTPNERTSIFQQYTPQIENSRWRAKLAAYYEVQQRIGVGEYFPKEVVFRDARGNTRSLEEFKGKIVLIDVWATWCGPCKYQKPFLIDHYRNTNFDNLVLLGLSIDQKKSEWDKHMQSTEEEFEQWYVEDPMDFVRQLDVSSIPRFILLNPEGRFLNSKMPFPSDSQVFMGTLMQGINTRLPSAEGAAPATADTRASE